MELGRVVDIFPPNETADRVQHYKRSQKHKNLRNIQQRCVTKIMEVLQLMDPSQLFRRVGFILGPRSREVTFTLEINFPLFHNGEYILGLEVQFIWKEGYYSMYDFGNMLFLEPL
jgi:hypothetical protein